MTVFLHYLNIAEESPQKEKSEVVDEDDDDDPNRDSLYQVPPPAKPLADLPRGYIKTVSMVNCIDLCLGI